MKPTLPPSDPAHERGADDVASAEHAAEHAAVWAAIPWCVMGTASAEEAARAQAHLVHCADCRAEWGFNQRLQRGLQLNGLRLETESTADAEAGLKKLLARIDDDAMIELQPLPPQPLKTAAPAWMRLLAVAAVVQAVGLAALAALWWQQSSGEGSYQTLSRDAATLPLVVQQRRVPAHSTLAEMQAEAAREGLAVLRVEPARDGGWVLHLATPATAQPAAAAGTR